MAAHWAYISMNLQLMTTNPRRLARERQVFNDINFHLPNYHNASLHSQMVRNPVNSAAYFWNEDWGHVSRPGQDTSHANNVLAYIVEAHDRGLGSYPATSLLR